MELSKAKDIHVGGQAAKELWLGGRMVWAAMPEAIRQSMVLWYDLRRQGATNQSMAADPSRWPPTRACSTSAATAITPRARASRGKA